MPQLKFRIYMPNPKMVPLFQWANGQQKKLPKTCGVCKITFVHVIMLPIVLKIPIPHLHLSAFSCVSRHWPRIIRNHYIIIKRLEIKNGKTRMV